MTELYDKSSVDSIVNFAKLITGKSLDEFTTLPREVINPRNRGDLGVLIEDFLFQHRPKNDKNPDFAEAGVELKTTGVVKDKNNGYRAKERLVLTQINYQTLDTESWESSSLLHKCSLMLIMFYLYDNQVPVYDQKFVVPPLLLEFPGEDFAQIRRDWEIIQSKIRAGKAHELSEGDTYYLSACRKGSGGPNEKLLKQPHSDIEAKSRAFSLKAGYVTKLLQQHAGEPSLGVSSGITFEEATALRFKPYMGRTVKEISKELNFFKQSTNQKGFNRSLANRILAHGGGEVSELAKAGIQLKTVRLGRTGSLKESMAFRGFDFMTIRHEKWESSTFAAELETKFLFVVFKFDDEGNERLFKVGYWNMPFADRQQAKEVWEETQRRVEINCNDLPKASESNVAHVRPKARDGQHTALTPQGTYVVKKGFWLNRGYVEKVVHSL